MPARLSACQCGVSRPDASAGPTQPAVGPSAEPRTRTWPWGVAAGLAVFGAFLLYRAGERSSLDAARLAERWQKRRQATPAAAPARTPLPAIAFEEPPPAAPPAASLASPPEEESALAIGFDSYSLYEVGPAAVRYVGSDVTEALVVSHVYPYGPAERAGLRDGDVVLRIDERVASSREVLREVLASRHAQDAVTVEFLRERNPQKTTLVLEPGSAVFGRACDGGDGSACLVAGNAARDGADGLAPDAARAVAYFERACSAGRHAGCINLGRMLRDGRGAPADPRRAADLFEDACDAGVGAGCHNLAILYVEGLGVDRDEPRARELARRACLAGDEDACGPDGAPVHESP